MVEALAALPKLTYLDLNSNALAAAGAAAIAPHINSLSRLQVACPSRSFLNLCWTVAWCGD